MNRSNVGGSVATVTGPGDGIVLGTTDGSAESGPAEGAADADGGTEFKLLGPKLGKFDG